ncbi:hypothetical protein Pst134EA_021334 [Puccinia striiformis f. sp. tritici]|uniref:hypothetical protein n=1 Tax=Puccinia striiformis f. sp. tritici TaxID=168172 RepID=UPI0020089AB4|nr:hypothetical protein Pst134EA_021334 [Puccinia striiformis f. sp. tritici]KAH9457458.1 hypothetical protein Pst134EA_021334 [Puccinia striiformis f. sp. tritici]
MRAAVRIVSLSVKQQRLGLGLSAQQQHYQTISSTERKKTGTARPRPTTNRVASIQNNPRKLIGAATTRRGLDRDLVELLKALGHTLPISCPLITNDRSPFSMGMTSTRYDQLDLSYSQDYLVGHWRSLSVIS